MGVLFDDRSVFERAGLAFIRVDTKIDRLAAVFGNEPPLHSRGKSGPSTPPESGERDSPQSRVGLGGGCSWSRLFGSSAAHLLLERALYYHCANGRTKSKRRCWAMISAGIERAIQESFRRAQDRYPSIRLPYKRFVERLERSIGGVAARDPAFSESVWLESFERLHHVDLFLATACADGDRLAWDSFAETYFDQVRRWAAASLRNLVDAEDLTQDLMAAFFSGTQEGVNRISGYSGKGSLASWLRVTVTRASIDRFRRTRKQVPLEEVSLAGQDSLDQLDSRWGPVLADLLQVQLTGLSNRDRLILGLYYLHGTPLRLIASHFNVHEATVSRWLGQLRKRIRKNVERAMKHEHGMRSREVQSLWRWVAEENRLSLEELLAE